MRDTIVPIRQRLFSGCKTVDGKGWFSGPDIFGGAAKWALFVLVLIGIIFLGYVIFIAVSVFKELWKNKKG